ncbi:MAG: glycerol-3-phosphate dehydrogenase/oxidase [Gammaproteobacteria bacterium]
MTEDRYDIAVVGAGIHGAGVAQAAAGYRTLVIEKSAPGAGTSSRSSKLIHGGLRYLESGQVRLVRESLREREILLRIAPSLVRRVPFLIPVYQDSVRPAWKIRLGLSVYALLGGGKRGTRFRSLVRNAWDTLGGLRMAGLRAVFEYWDAQTDDAGLTRAVLGSAKAYGAEVIYPALFEGAVRDGDAYRIRYRARGQVRTCVATVLINAGGPWVNEIQERAQAPSLAIDLVQGTHIHFDRPLIDRVFYVESPRDRRPVFVMPWRDATLVGTTESLFRSDPESVRPLPQEIEYLEETVRHYFPRYPGKRMTAMAGLRVLPKQDASLQGRSRETVLLCDDPARPHLVAIYGGKLTAYRATAAKVLRILAPSLPPLARLIRTDAIELSASAIG